MIDIHCHLLNEVDDGSESIEQSLEALRLAEEAGFTDIILTPHYIKGYYDNSIENTKEKIKNLKQEVFKNNILINIHHGNEIYICDDLCELLLANVPATLANSKYVLFELPLNNKLFNVMEIVVKLKEKGYIPVLAHPERYSYVQEDPNQVMEFIRAGVFIQSNYGSIVGRYGKEAKETLGKLLKHNMVHILASDTHKKGFIYENIQDILKEIGKYTSKQAIKRLTKINRNCIIQDEEFQIEVPTRIEERKKFFFI